MNTAYYQGPHIPLEWIAAHGIKPRRLVLHAGRNDARHAGVCFYAQALLQEAPSLDRGLLVLAGACDQVRRVAAILGAQAEHGGIFLFHVPATRGRAAAGLFRDECLRLSRFLVQWGGQAPRRDAPFTPIADVRTIPSADGVPVAVIGGPLLAEHEELYTIVQRLGGAVVVDGAEGGERTAPALPPGAQTVDLLDAVVSARFEAIPDAFQRPNAKLRDWLLERVKEHGVRGLICYSYTWCDLWRAEQHHLAEAAGIPALFLEFGAELRITGRNITRIEAFLESISCSMLPQK